jgi:hypothetical protein
MTPAVVGGAVCCGVMLVDGGLMRYDAPLLLGDAI